MLKHKSGCADVSVDVDIDVGEDHLLLIGVIFLLFSPILILWRNGFIFSPCIRKSILTLFFIIIYILISMSAGWMAEVDGTVIVALVSTILGGLTGYLLEAFIWKRLSLRSFLTLLCFIGGFFLGNLVFAIICASSGWRAAWGYWLISTAIGILGGAISLKLEYGMFHSVIFIGSYLLMRAWTMFFPKQYPSELYIFSEDDVDRKFSPFFWAFVGVYIFGLITGYVSMFYQIKQMEEDCDRPAE